VLEIVDRRQGLREPLLDGHPYLAAEAVHAVRREMALHVADVLFRRTHLGWETRETEEAARRTARLMGDELGWDAERREREVEEVLEIRRREEAFREELESTWEG
jgi:glycerol-3-phosphate dehydrogenase